MCGTKGSQMWWLALIPLEPVRHQQRAAWPAAARTSRCTTAAAASLLPCRASPTALRLRNAFTVPHSGNKWGLTALLPRVAPAAAPACGQPTQPPAPF